MLAEPSAVAVADVAESPNVYAAERLFRARDGMKCAVCGVQIKRRDVSWRIGPQQGLRRIP
jgi:hypothetical protein